MPHYRFNIIDRDIVVPDEEGLDLPSDDEALREARASAFDMLRDAALNGFDIRHQLIEVMDGERLVGRISVQSVLS